MEDEKYIRIAIELALRGEGQVEPNPLVGAIIVKNNRIIGTGYHAYLGGPHAEIDAINSVTNPGLLKGATLYLSLEPCIHFGKTPPCARAIVQTGIKKVVIATRDPNPVVNGKGINFLKQHGKSVIEGVLKEEAQNINKPFFKLHQKGLPYIVAKWAMSLDGKIATPSGESKWITSVSSRNLAKNLRTKMNGVMVGIGTILKDNPYLLGLPGRKNPTRIILDSQARLPLTSNLVRTLDKGDVYLLVSSCAPVKNVRLLEQKGVRVFRVPAGQAGLHFTAMLKILAKNGVNKLMIEGGGEVLGNAFKEKIVDEVYAFIAPKILNTNGTNGTNPTNKKNVGARCNVPLHSDVLQLKNITIKYLNPDILIHGYIT